MLEILPLLIFLSGSAMGSRIVDVSRDPRFQDGYRVGQTYRLRTSGFVVKPLANGDWQLWTPADQSAEPSSTAVAVPAGSTVRINRLGYLYDDYHPPLPGGQAEIMYAYGTLTLASGSQWPQPVMVLPLLRNPKSVPGTSVQVYPVDGE